jgi:hypothetical protein
LPLHADIRAGAERLFFRGDFPASLESFGIKLSCVAC